MSDSRSSVEMRPREPISSESELDLVRDALRALSSPSRAQVELLERLQHPLGTERPANPAPPEDRTGSGAVRGVPTRHPGSDHTASRPPHALSPGGASSRFTSVGDEGDSPWARVDVERSRRSGLPEVIFAASKTSDQVRRLARVHAVEEGCALATRVDVLTAGLLVSDHPSSEYHDVARVWSLGRRDPLHSESPVPIVAAGTSDLPVAEEARVCLEWFGVETTRYYDVGVAGLERVLSQVEALSRADVVIVVAGMDGALPTVVAGLIAAPVIAVPTSVGYGASFEGLTPLLTMITSCAPGVGVVNIDNGFGGAALAYKMLARQLGQR